MRMHHRGLADHSMAAGPHGGQVSCSRWVPRHAQHKACMRCHLQQYMHACRGQDKHGMQQQPLRLLLSKDIFCLYGRQEAFQKGRIQSCDSRACLILPSWKITPEQTMLSEQGRGDSGLHNLKVPNQHRWKHMCCRRCEIIIMPIKEPKARNLDLRMQ